MSHTNYNISELCFKNIASRFCTLALNDRKNHIKAITSTKTCTEIVRNMLMFLFEKDFNRQECIQIWKLNFSDKGIDARKKIMKKIENAEYIHKENLKVLLKEKCLEDKYAESQTELIEVNHNLNKSEQKCNQYRFELSQLNEKYQNLKSEHKKSLHEKHEFELKFNEKSTECSFLIQRLDDKQLIIDDKQLLIDHLLKKNV